jgi:hypothetical protein
MDALNNAVKITATDRTHTDHHGARTILCGVNACLGAATWTFWHTDGSVVRRCTFHDYLTKLDVWYARANHAPITTLEA